MGILGALTTAVSGLSAQSYALENISGNIANASTVGFKRVDTSFVDLIPDSPARKEVAGSVGANSQLTNTIQGTLSSTGIGTNMALSGEGYFTVAQNTGSAATPTFAIQNYYTRRGDFSEDANGYLTNGAGYYLVGTSYNPANGAVVTGSTSPIQLSKASIPARGTSTVTYHGNLPLLPKPGSYSVTAPNSELLRPADYATNPVTTGTVTANDQATFMNQSIPGGEITVYNPAGAAPTAQFRLAKTDSAASGGTDTWQLFYQTNAAATGTGVAWRSVGAPMTFNASGAMTSAATRNITGMVVNGTTVGDVAINFGSSLTQYGDPSGAADTSQTQNGYASGKLNSVAVANDGAVTGSYSNGLTTKMAQITVAQFAANDLLKRETGGAFSATAASGAPTYGLDGSTLTGGSVEQSNTDISEEFSKMIVTQQAYSANTRVMSTAQQMLQDVINVVR
jgi:flagellar hook protein FlgE